MGVSSVRYIWVLCLLMYCTLIYFLSDQSRLPLPDLLNFQMSDKLIHALAYAVMAFLFWQAGKAWMIHRGKIQWSALAVLCVLFCACYGLSDEWHQSFVEGRDASVWDWVADTMGAMLLTIMLKKWEFALSRASNSLT